VEPLATTPVVLLGEARAAGLTVEADGDRLVVRGTKSQGQVVDRLLAHKAGVLAVLASEAHEVAWRIEIMAMQIPAIGTIPFLVARPNHAGPADCLSCGDPMEAGQRYKCRACAEAARRVVVADEAERAARSARKEVSREPA